MTMREFHYLPLGRRRRRGIASVLAMLYLVLFSTLAVGFAAATAMNAQVSKNERSLQQADAAADGGMQFIRYQLGAMSIPANTPTSGLMAAVTTALGTQLNGTSNMNGNTVTNSNGTIYLPSATGWTTLDPTVGTQFRAKITQSGQFLVVAVEGSGSRINVKKALQLQYQQAPKAGAILDYGVANEGTVATAGSTVIQGLTDPTKGSVLSADMISATPVVIDGKSVSGDISIVDPNGSISVSGASVGGTSNPTQMQQHLHIGVPAPVFPTVDTSVFTQYATTQYTSGMSTLTNVYIPANTNPSFSGNTTINGVLYIEAPNNVTFRGNMTICGVIVSQTGSGAPGFNASSNTISIAGNVSATTIDQLPASVPNAAALQQLTGAFMLAPNFAVSVTGNFGTVSGSIVVGQLTMSGNAGGTVQGSVIGMQDLPLSLNGHSSITISSTGTTNYPSGMSFGLEYTALPGTYLEVLPW